MANKRPAKVKLPTVVRQPPMPAVPEKAKPDLKRVGGSRSDTWNNALAKQALSTGWYGNNANTEHINNQHGAIVGFLVGVEPQDELESMLAAQLIASHNAAIECYRRSMIPEQTFEGRSENLNQANKLSRTYATLLEALNRHRGKCQQKVTVEHVHVHEGGQAIVGNIGTDGGRALTKPKATLCSWICTRHRDAEREHGAGGRASHLRCQTAVAGCTAAHHQARQRAIGTLSVMVGTRQRPSFGD